MFVQIKALLVFLYIFIDIMLNIIHNILSHCKTRIFDEQNNEFIVLIE